MSKQQIGVVGMARERWGATWRSTLKAVVIPFHNFNRSRERPKK